MPGDVGIARVHDLDAAFRNGADIGRGAADVDRDQVVATAQQAFRTAPDDAAGGSGDEHGDGAPRTHLDGRDATVRLDDPKHRAKSVLLQRALQFVQIGRRLGPDEGVHGRGREAFELAQDVGHFCRTADVGIRHLTADDLLGAALVGVVEEGRT